MAIAVYEGVERRHNLFQKKEIDSKIREATLNDYQYFGDSVRQIAETHGLSRYMVNQLASKAEEEGKLVKRKARNKLAREILTTPEVDLTIYNDNQREYVAKYSDYLKRQKENYKTSRRNTKIVPVKFYQEKLNILNVKRNKKETNLLSYENRVKGLLSAPEEKANAILLHTKALVKQEILNGGLELAIANENGYSIEEIAETFDYSEERVREIIAGAKEYTFGDGDVKNKLLEMAEKDSNINHRKMATKYGMKYSNPEDAEDFRKLFLEREILEEKLKEEYSKPLNNKVEKIYLTGHRPSIFSLEYWQDGLFRQDLKDIFKDSFTYVCVGLTATSLVAGVYGLVYLDNHVKAEKSKIEAKSFVEVVKPYPKISIFEIIDRNSFAKIRFR